MISDDICLCLSSCTVIISRSVYIAANSIIACFLWLNSIPLRISCIFFTILLWVDIYLILFVVKQCGEKKGGCLQLLETQALNLSGGDATERKVLEKCYYSVFILTNFTVNLSTSLQIMPTH